ncbi:glutathione S-transferase [Leucosporidium creatinivorum]|uniref:Glutathione S-transferase n=1 Tax=Leucosporidium creatinivorum TaxID=106004 RepID=A0A1Y2ES06_9BASI|nr:glutathione S-transferase [Leucosporidium creatinivorum]
MAPIIFYDLVTRPGGPYWSPNTWKTRLSLLHKGVEFETREVTFTELRALAPRWGVKRAIAPSIELTDGTIISDSWKIAEWLEKTYPDRPSLFLPSSKTPVDGSSPEMQVARSYAVMFNAGYGDSDPGWATFFELVAKTLEQALGSEDREYYTSDAKLGVKDGWKKLTSADPTSLLERSKASVLALEAVLRVTPFLTGDAPGFVDYVAYGRYAMMANLDPKLTDEVWRERETPELREWIARIEARYASELKEALSRTQNV